MKTNEDNSQLKTLIRVFMIIGCVLSGIEVIPLAWTIPMTVILLRKLDRNEPISLAFKVCTLLFCSMVSGIMLLCLDD